MTCSNSVKEGWSYSGLNNTFFFFIGSLLHIVSLWRLPWNSQLSFSVYCVQHQNDRTWYILSCFPRSQFPADWWSSLSSYQDPALAVTRSVTRDQSEASSGTQLTNERLLLTPNHWPDTFTIARATNGRLSSKFPILLLFTCMHQELSKKNPPKRLLCG